MGLLTLHTPDFLSELEKKKPEKQTLRIYEKDNKTAN